MSETFIDFQCEGCGRKAKASIKHIGRSVKCPSCSAKMIVPGTVLMEPDDDLPANNFAEYDGEPPPIQERSGHASDPRPTESPPFAAATDYASHSAPLNVYGDRHVSPNGIVVPILISAIGNVIVGVAWVSTCFMAIVGIPMIVLAVFEFMLFAKAGQITPRALAEKSHLIGILEIVAGVFNLISLPCGILVLIYGGKIKNSSARRR